jgi:hypothetical protein
MTPGSSTPGYGARNPAASACRDGDNLILFDSDRAREKTVNRAGAAVWDAMDGTARTEDLAAALARRYEIAPTDGVLADARAFAEELLCDGFAAAASTPRSAPCRRRTTPGSPKRRGRWICR